MSEPLAWIALNQLSNTYSAFTSSDKERMLPHVQQLYANWIPLYTNPTELTDEEINDIYDEWQALSGDPVKLYEFFKLKAQEK